MAVRYGILGGLAAGCVMGLSVSAASLPVPQAENFDNGWRFERFGKLPDGVIRHEPSVSPAEMNFDDSSWQRVDLPHDWAIAGPFCWDVEGEVGKLPWRGIGWYCKDVNVSESDRGKNIFLEFDGIMANSEVYLNGTKVGGRPYGYSSFHVDLTPQIRFGERNRVAVRVDAGKWGSRWYPGAGIYRHVRWVVKNPVHFERWGVQLAPTVDSVGNGDLFIQTRVGLGRFAAKVFEIGPAPEFKLKNAKFSSYAFSYNYQYLKANFPDVKLWSPENPNRYLLELTLLDEGKVTDIQRIVFGFKSVVLDPDSGMFLNGKPYKIQGVCMHHDLGALGAATNTAAIRRQIKLLKSFGTNAIRFSHNPPSPEYLDLCDEMGILVQDESFDTWHHAKKQNDYSSLFNAWSDRDVRDMVRRDRNHVSVFMWSIGNEIDEQYQGKKGGEVGKKLADAVREEDPLKRPVCAGVSFGPGGWNGFAETALDAMGYNYRLSEYAKWYKEPLSKKMPLHGSETASTVSSRGEYFFPVKREDASMQNNSAFQVSSYDLQAPPWGNSPDEQFFELDRFPAAFGEFVWTGFDYLGEPTPYNSDHTNVLNFAKDDPRRLEMEKELSALGKIRVPSRSSYFGIFDLAGFPKDRMYIYQARWMPDVPMAHILPHWNWSERIGLVTPVHVYSSGDEAELFLNGVSQGRKKRGLTEYRFRWDEVKYAPGELRVTTWKKGTVWAEAVQKTTGEAVRAIAKTDRSTIAADGCDLAFITVKIADKEGLLVPRSSHKVRFEIDGPGEFVASDNGDAASFESFVSPERKAFNGLCLGIVKAKKGANKPFTVKISAEGLEGTAVVINPLGNKR